MVNRFLTRLQMDVIKVLLDHNSGGIGGRTKDEFIIDLIRVGLLDARITEFDGFYDMVLIPNGGTRGYDAALDM